MATWSIPIEKLVAKTGQKIDKAVKAATFEIFKAVILKSPVDTGRFRANWQFSRGTPAQGINLAFDTSGALAIAGASKALTTNLGSVVYLVNNLPYAERLEYESWSKQAPSGMVRLTIREFMSHLDKAARAVQ